MPLLQRQMGAYRSSCTRARLVRPQGRLQRDWDSGGGDRAGRCRGSISFQEEWCPAPRGGEDTPRDWSSRWPLRIPIERSRLLPGARLWMGDSLGARRGSADYRGGQPRFRDEHPTPSRENPGEVSCFCRREAGQEGLERRGEEAVVRVNFNPGVVNGGDPTGVL